MSSEDTFNISVPINGEADFSNHSYQSIFGKEPPLGFHEWLQFAKKQQCTTALSTYQQIYDDLAPFDRIYSKDFDLINRKGPARQQYITKGVFTKRRGFESKAMSPHLRLPLWNIFRSSTIKDFKYITSNMDEPISLPATDEYTGSYMNVNDTFIHNSCLRDRFDTKTGNETTPRMAHGYLLSPASFITQNINVPVLGMTKIPCFRDVMVPGSTSHVPITMNGRVEDEIPWKDKKNVLFWRGSTTGGQ
ncbi:F-actin-capping protein subunit beta, partial [Rhizoclosmatium sp. JEL0117]